MSYVQPLSFATEKALPSSDVHSGILLGRTPIGSWPRILHTSVHSKTRGFSCFCSGNGTGWSCGYVYGQTLMYNFMCTASKLAAVFLGECIHEWFVCNTFLCFWFLCFTVCNLLLNYKGCFSIKCLSCFSTDQAWKARKATCGFPDVVLAPELKTECQIYRRFNPLLKPFLSMATP